VNRLKAGETIALISDAGTPGISDPGFYLAREAIAAGITVQTLPGATAMIPALVSSGFPCDRFCFEGFLPQKKGRKTHLESLAEETRTMVFYESPYRVVKTLEQFAEVFGADRQVSCCREISKLHEESVRGTLTEVIAHFKETEPRGEFVIVVAGKERVKSSDRKKQTDNKLNVAYELGEQEGQKGAEMVRKVLKDNFDLDIKYYALVDFQAFATAIDTLFPDGVTIDAKFSTLEGQLLTEATVGDDLHATETESPTQTIKVGKQQMNGSTLLNYARFRDDDEGDYGRTKRQQQVLTAVLQQLKDPTKLFTGSEALGKVFGMTSTNVPYSFLLTNGLSFLDGAQNGIERLTVPELGDWVDAYDVYGGQALLVDQNKYQTKLAQMGMR